MILTLKNVFSQLFQSLLTEMSLWGVMTFLSTAISILQKTSCEPLFPLFNPLIKSCENLVSYRALQSYNSPGD